MNKRILPAAMALSMLAAQVPMASFAQEASMSEEELVAALSQAQSGETVELTGSVELTSQLVIEKEIVLDGNGYTIAKGESEDASPNNAGILVTAGATLRDVTIEGPNTTPSGWDNGEFGIKLYNAQGALLQDITVEQANAGIQVNGGSVTMTGTITVSDNEFGGIEVCRQAQLDLSKAVLINESESKEVPTLWSDSGKGTILANEEQNLYLWPEYTAGKDHLYLSSANLAVEAQVNGVAYETLAQALEAAGLSEGDRTVALLKDVTVTEQAESRTSGAVLTLPAGVTLDGKGYTLSYAGDADIDSFLAMDGAENVIRDTSIVADGKAKHVLTLAGAENARLDGVTVQGGREAAVLVNGASVVLENTALKPAAGAEASIAYQADSKLPSLTLNNVEASAETSLLYISKETLKQIGTLGGAQDMDEILEQVQASLSGSDRVELNYDEVSGSVSAPATVRYEITLEPGENGAVTADHTRAQSGTLITLTVEAEEGYQLKKLEVLDSRDQAVELTQQENGSYTFTMPESPVTVTAAFAQAEEEPIFQDVTETDWFYAAVQFVYEKGIMSGVEEGLFAPHTVLTRAMLVQTLYALEGKPQAEGGERFEDVSQEEWYADAVAWAAQNGLVAGVGEDRFAPEDALTREQMALILYRYAQHKSYDVQVEGEPLESFQDKDEISAWAEEALAWAVDAKLLSGTGESCLSPGGTATRAQVAQVLANFCQTIV